MWRDDGQELLKVSHHPTNYSGHKHCVSGDIIVLVCQVILQDYVIKGSRDFIEESLSW